MHFPPRIRWNTGGTGGFSVLQPRCVSDGQTASETISPSAETVFFGPPGVFEGLPQGPCVKVKMTKRKAFTLYPRSSHN